MNPLRKPIKLAFLASTLNVGGAERVIEMLSTGLSQRGFGLDVFCLKEAGEVGEKLMQNGVGVTERISGKRIDPLAVVKLYSLLKGDYDILLSLDHRNACFYGAIASYLAGVKARVLAVHSTGLWGKGVSLTLSDRIVLPMYHRVVALARNHRDYLVVKEGVPEEKVVVIPNGVDTSLYAPMDEASRREKRKSMGIDQDSTVVSIVAALRPEKNHRMLLEAARNVLRRNSKVVFLVVGDGDERMALEGLCSSLGIEKKVRFLGVRDDVSELLGITDISVLCSYPVVETFPVSVLEAMSCGVAVVSTNVGSVKEIIENEENGILIESEDAGALEREILRLIEYPGLRRRLGERARETVEGRYSKTNMLDGYERLFVSLLEKK